MSKQINIATIGGGTGQYELLKSLVRHIYLNLSAIVTMADDGGSSGELRTELGVLPPGDVRQCLVALAGIAEEQVIELMGFRFNEGRFEGDNVGNLLLAACEKMWGLEKGIEFVSNLLQVTGKVLPVTYSDTELVAYMTTGQIIRGEDAIGDTDLFRLKELHLESKDSDIKVNPNVLSTIEDADHIIVGPGDLHTSILPNLLVPQVCSAIRESGAKLMYICNLMTKPGQTDGLSVQGFVHGIEKYIDRPFDYILFNTAVPEQSILEMYEKEGEHLVDFENCTDTRFIGRDLISNEEIAKVTGDRLKRSLVRHDRSALANAILEIING
jgi:uncharacterized cofD-like protein